MVTFSASYHSPVIEPEFLTRLHTRSVVVASVRLSILYTEDLADITCKLCTSCFGSPFH